MEMVGHLGGGGVLTCIQNPHLTGDQIYDFHFPNLLKSVQYIIAERNLVTFLSNLVTFVYYFLRAKFFKNHICWHTEPCHFPL